MVLTRWLSRSLVLIALAGSFGMFAQEMVSRMLMADDQPVAMTSTIGPTWQSAESFYGHHPGVFRQPSVALAQSPLIDTIDASIETAEVESFVAKESNPAETIDSAESAPVMAQSSPEPVLVASVMPAQSAADGPGSAPIVPPEPVDPSPELPERRPPTIPDFGPAQAADLPPPEPRKPELDEPVLPEVYLPPRRPRTPPRPAEIAESAPVPDAAAYPHASPHDASRYLDPAELVRQRGIERGQQLQRRLEARRMMGYHSLRPPVDASPYSSGNPIRPVVIVVPRTVVVQQR
ncbi:MAG: hypothetical protein EA424_23105 [Planctomycetaceae bacterium]|nr:MAG: hypothetical protein EA424_23105 [Planctomycetaceae bacterium]